VSRRLPCAIDPLRPGISWDRPYAMIASKPPAHAESVLKGSSTALESETHPLFLTALR
jgi:hypothetical protein